jgi:hypothetical protein
MPENAGSVQTWQSAPTKRLRPAGSFMKRQRIQAIMLATAKVRERTALSCSLCRMSCSARVRSSSGKPEERLRSLPASASSGGEPFFL